MASIWIAHRLDLVRDGEVVVSVPRFEVVPVSAYNVLVEEKQALTEKLAEAEAQARFSDLVIRVLRAQLAQARALSDRAAA